MTDFASWLFFISLFGQLQVISVIFVSHIDLSPVVAENPKIRSFDTLVGLTPYTQPWHIVVTGHSINQAHAGKTPGQASESPPK